MSSNRTTLEDVRSAFRSLREAVRAAEITCTTRLYNANGEATGVITFDADDLHLEEGSQTYGRAFRVYWSSIEKGASGHYTFEREFMGWTRREAELSMRAMAAGIWAAIHARLSDVNA